MKNYTADEMKKSETLKKGAEEAGIPVIDIPVVKPEAKDFDGIPFLNKN